MVFRAEIMCKSGQTEFVRKARTMLRFTFEVHAREINATAIPTDDKATGLT